MENNESYVQLAGVERKTMNWFGGHALANKLTPPDSLRFDLCFDYRAINGSQRTDETVMIMPSFLRSFSFFLCLHAYYVDYQLWSWRRQSNKRECMLQIVPYNVYFFISPTIMNSYLLQYCMTFKLSIMKMMVTILLTCLSFITHCFRWKSVQFKI